MSVLWSLKFRLPSRRISVIILTWSTTQPSMSERLKDIDSSFRQKMAKRYKFHPSLSCPFIFLPPTFSLLRFVSELPLRCINENLPGLIFHFSCVFHIGPMQNLWILKCPIWIGFGWISNLASELISEFNYHIDSLAYRLVLVSDMKPINKQ